MRRWTPEERLKQAEAIRRWKPWEKSTGPKTAQGKAKVRLNGLKTGEHTASMRNMRSMLNRMKRDRMAALDFLKKIET
jgi:translation initiation factor 2 beta subunit (eIF-2beta)/eIF-5